MSVRGQKIREARECGKTCTGIILAARCVSEWKETAHVLIDVNIVICFTYHKLSLASMMSSNYMGSVCIY